MGLRRLKKIKTASEKRIVDIKKDLRKLESIKVPANKEDKKIYEAKIEYLRSSIAFHERIIDY